MVRPSRKPATQLTPNAPRFQPFTALLFEISKNRAEQMFWLGGDGDFRDRSRMHTPLSRLITKHPRALCAALRSVYPQTTKHRSRARTTFASDLYPRQAGPQPRGTRLSKRGTREPYLETPRHLAETVVVSNLKSPCRTPGYSTVGDNQQRSFISFDALQATRNLEPRLNPRRVAVPERLGYFHLRHTDPSLAV